MKTMYLLCGLPGSGKSTWAKEQIRENGGVHISRDEIRFANVKEDEYYFSKEKEVYKIFTANIQYYLYHSEEDIYVDATHLTKASRNKLFNALDIPPDWKVIGVFFDLPLEICIERNNLRSGREKVPEDVIRNMARTLRGPSLSENHYYSILVKKA